MSRIPQTSMKFESTYNPHVILTGVSFRTLDVDGRERLVRQVQEPERLAATLVQQGLAAEAAVISTCNRFEIVTVGGESGGGIRAFFEGLLGRPGDPSGALYQYVDAQAVRHVYRVSSSLDSMVVGEAQILGQVKDAYRKAVQEGIVGTHLHHLFQSAFNVAKKVRARTEVSHHGVSISYIAVRLAQQIFEDLADTRVMIIGSGEMAELAALHLCSHGCTKITVANRTVERAAELAERFGGAAVSLTEIPRVIDTVDIVIGSVRSDHAVVTPSTLSTRDKGRPLFLIDLGVPRNFAPELSDRDSVYLYNIDDLAGIAAENQALRDAAAKEAEIIIDYGLIQFERWRTKLAAQPELVDLRARIRAICDLEVQEHVGSSGVSSEAVDALAHALTGKISHEIVEMIARQRGLTNNDEDLAPFVLVPKVDRE